MEFTQFTERLHKVNPNLKIARKDYTDAGYCKEFRNIGLFNGTTYLFAVPRNYIPKWSIKSSKEQILARGWVAILERLIQLKLATREKCEKVFDCVLFQYPQNARPFTVIEVSA